jgi:CRP-like cAMP-binding protein
MTDGIRSSSEFPDPELGKLLAQLPLFEGLAPNHIAALCADGPLVTHLPHAALMRQGEIDRVAFIILSGCAKVCVEVETGAVDIATLGAGALIGEISLLCGTPRGASVIAIEPIRSLRIDTDLLERWCAENSRITRNALRLLAQRLASTVQPVAYFMAAAHSLREGHFNPGVLTHVRDRDDELGDFARAFIKMADAIHNRETALRREVRELTIQIDEIKRARQVAEITETDHFRELQSRARELRGRKRGDPG